MVYYCQFYLHYQKGALPDKAGKLWLGEWVEGDGMTFSDYSRLWMFQDPWGWGCGVPHQILFVGFTSHFFPFPVLYFFF